MLHKIAGELAYQMPAWHWLTVVLYMREMIIYDDNVTVNGGMTYHVNVMDQERVFSCEVDK